MTAGILRISSTLCLAYLVAWTIGYVIVVSDDYGRIDWSYYGKYIQLFWSGSGLEMPVFAGIISLIAFVPTSLLLLWFQQRQLKHLFGGRRHSNS